MGSRSSEMALPSWKRSQKMKKHFVLIITAILALVRIEGNAAESNTTQQPIFNNPDFEQYAPWTRPATSKHPWNFKGGKAGYWYYNENTTVDAEIRTDGAPSGKAYLRMSSPKGTIWFGQFIDGLKNFPKGLKKADVSLKVRGKCEVIIYVSGKPAVPGNRLTVNVDSPDKWFEVKGTLGIPETPNFLWIRINSTSAVDVDDFRFTPVADAPASSAATPGEAK